MIKQTKDGRTIRTGKDYTEFRRDIYMQQAGTCATCGYATDFYAEPIARHSFHVHHKNGRGMGGSKRDDSTKSTVGLCGTCHRREHGQ